MSAFFARRQPQLCPKHFQDGDEEDAAEEDAEGEEYEEEEDDDEEVRVYWCKITISCCGAGGDRQVSCVSNPHAERDCSFTRFSQYSNFLEK